MKRIFLYRRFKFFDCLFLISSEKTGERFIDFSEKHMSPGVVGIELDNLFNAVFPENHGYTEVNILLPVFTVEADGYRESLFLVIHDGLGH